MNILIGIEDAEGQEEACVDFVVECTKMLRGGRVVGALAAFVDARECFKQVDPEDSTCEGRGDVEGRSIAVVVGDGDGRASGRVVDVAPLGGLGAAGEFIEGDEEVARSGSRPEGQDSPMVATRGVMREDCGLGAVLQYKDAGAGAGGNLTVLVKHPRAI